MFLHITVFSYVLYLQMLSEWSTQDVKVTPAVAGLVDHIWREAHGRLEEQLATSLSAITLDQASDLLYM